MKWLEVIEIRTVESNHKLVKKELTALIKKVNKESDQQIIKLYVHANLKTDICIHIIHDTAKCENRGSELGLSIASNIKEFGLVNHYVLQEIIPSLNNWRKENE